MSQHERNTDNMVKFNKAKSAVKNKAVDEAIQRLIKKGQAINFNSVVAEAGVSKSYLYNNASHRRRIEDLRQQQTGRMNQQPSRSEKKDASKDIVIASLRKRIQELESKLTVLERENKKLRGKIYESV